VIGEFSSPTGVINSGKTRRSSARPRWRSELEPRRRAVEQLVGSMPTVEEIYKADGPGVAFIQARWGTRQLAVRSGQTGTAPARAS